jgi:pimeloyl-ACP methyl ester carboxylesterase
MTLPSMRPLETALVELFQHLGIGRAHFAAGQLVPTDWTGLAARYPEHIASLTLVSPRVRRPELESLGPRLMVLAGDTGPSGEGSARLLAELTQARSLMLRDYECLPWSDLVADRGTETVAGWLRFLDGLPLPELSLPDGEGEVAGISYRIRGSGRPLVIWHRRSGSPHPGDWRRDTGSRVRRDIERPSEPIEHGDGGIFQLPFQSADIGAINTGISRPASRRWWRHRRCR